MNLEKMRIGFKPSGFSADKGQKQYWNALELSISSKNTTARPHGSPRTLGIPLVCGSGLKPRRP